MGWPRPGDVESRYSLLSRSRTVFSFVFMAASLLLGVYLYSLLFGPSPFNKPTEPLFILLVVVAILATSIGLAAGTWTWGFLGKKFFGFARNEVEPLVTPMMPIPGLERYTNWYLNVLFGPKTAAHDLIDGSISTHARLIRV